jgi:hypothetical protein
MRETQKIPVGFLELLGRKTNYAQAIFSREPQENGSQVAFKH